MPETYFPYENEEPDSFSDWQPDTQGAPEIPAQQQGPGMDAMDFEAQLENIMMPRITFYTPDNEQELQQVKAQKGVWPSLIRQMVKNLSIKSDPVLYASVEQREQDIDKRQSLLEGLKFKQAEHDQQREAAMMQAKRAMQQAALVQAAQNQRAKMQIEAARLGREETYKYGMARDAARIKADALADIEKTKYMIASGLKEAPDRRTEAQKNYDFIMRQRLAIAAAQKAAYNKGLKQGPPTTPPPPEAQIITMEELQKEQAAEKAKAVAAARIAAGVDTKLVKDFESAMKEHMNYGIIADTDPDKRQEMIDDVSERIAILYKISPAEAWARYQESKRNLGGVEEVNE